MPDFAPWADTPRPARGLQKVNRSTSFGVQKRLVLVSDRKIIVHRMYEGKKLGTQQVELSNIV